MHLLLKPHSHALTRKLRFHHLSPSKSAATLNLPTRQTQKLSFFNMSILKAIAKHLDTILGPGVTLLYPLYASVRAIETPSTLDDQQWLTYWVLYSLLTLFELSFYQVLAWIPIWPYLKLAWCMWLVLPMFNGAAYIYANFVSDYVKNIAYNYGYEYGDWNEEQKKVLQMLSYDTRKAVERYIERYGSNALERVIKVAEKEARRH